MYKILSIDGGGVRGIVPAIWMAELEKRIKGRIHDKFDMFIGTSVGSLITTAISNKIPCRLISKHF